MEADFSGWATKANLKCSDGRTISSDAFKHQDKTQVPLVWQHGHNNPENVLGHVILEHRDEGVYAHAFFNKTPKAKHAAELVHHRDIKFMSIYANELYERAKNVLHGAIKEVSLVISGANPGALIENVYIRHSDDSETFIEDEIVIFTGAEIKHSDEDESDEDESDEDESDEDESDEDESDEDESDEDEFDEDEFDEDEFDHSEEELNAIVHSMNGDQQSALKYLVNKALSGAVISHADLGDDATIKDIYESMNEQQKSVLHYMLGLSLDDADDTAKHDNVGDDKKGQEMARRNVFENKEAERVTLEHSDMKGIMDDASKSGSLADAVNAYALAHGIEDIDLLFPDAVAIDKMPEFLARRTEWVDKVIGVARKSPFSRIRTLSADLTMDQARAKGYVTGAMKKEEFFPIARRITQPTTVYKKQKLDRDDVVDITDFDVVAWLKGEMRLMLDEELARAVLVGDGRDVSDEDKINELCIRPIATDHELYATKVYVNLGNANSSAEEVIDAAIRNRAKYKGSGSPTFFAGETMVADFLLIKDTLGRRIYKTLDEVATVMRVKEIVPVEILDMPEYADIAGIMVNMADYVMGATAGGKVSMFDDFDIDYNQYKYLIETRLCGALTKLKSAIVIHKTGASATLVTPTAPTFDDEEGEVTIPTVTGVVYKDGEGTVINAAGSPYAVASGETYTVTAEPASSSYYFATSDDDTWHFTAD